jgi:peptide/nickel transport system substrate-binding protein
MRSATSGHQSARLGPRTARPWPAWPGGGRLRARVRACLTFTLILLLLTATACSSPEDGDGLNDAPTTQGVRGGTLRIANVAPYDSLDTAQAYGAATWALMRLYARTLYSWDSAAKGDGIMTPVPDLAAEPPSVSPDQRTYTFRLRAGVRWAPPVGREVVAADFVYAVERQLADGRPALNPYLPLIEGTAEFAAGRTDTVSGITALGDHELRITLTRPAADFLSILALPFFAPVPEEHASRYEIGEEYSAHVVGSGPYTLAGYERGKSAALVRNTNWDPATDHLRRAWVDRVEVTVYDPDPEEGETAPEESSRRVQEAIEEHEADLNGDAVGPPVEELQRLSTDPRLALQLGVKTTGCTRYLVFQTDAGPTADLKVRQAVNYAVDKVDLLTALGGRFAGEIASTVLPPSMAGYKQDDHYPSPGGRGDVDKARQLLREAGYPDGVTLNYVGELTGTGPAVTHSLERSLGRAGIRLNITAYPGYDRYTQSLMLNQKADEHQVGYARWCPDWPGDGARSFFAALLDGRKLTEANNTNYGNYNDPKVNALIDRALSEPAPRERAELWAQADREVMKDAAWAPLVYERQAYFWSARVKNWRFSPWVSNPDYANLWLDPYKP